MNKTVYTIHPPKSFVSKEQEFGHNIFHLETGHFICPREFSGAVISADNFSNLKSKFSLEVILILDRVKNSEHDICIINHVNKAGFDFMDKQSPGNDSDPSTDMSHIYQPIGDLEPSVVHTVGPDQFTQAENDGEIVSESVGLIAPLWHHVGVKVFARNFHMED